MGNKILITGKDNFIAQNIYVNLLSKKIHDVTFVGEIDNFNLLDVMISDYDIIIHSLTLYRGNNYESFLHWNESVTEHLVSQMNSEQKIIYVSSVRSGENTFYGLSKKRAEDAIIKYSNINGYYYTILRLENEFGKWALPDFNNVVATFCNNVANGKDNQVNNENSILRLQYIDSITASIVEEIMLLDSSIKYLPILGEISVGDLNKIINNFKELKAKQIPNVSSPLIKALYSTYLSYIPISDNNSMLEMHIDNRGSFTETFRLGGLGQVSINVSKPNTIKGNHYHNTKIEKFIVIQGKGILRLRHILNNQKFEYVLDSNKYSSFTIPPGYTHSIANEEEIDLVFLIWANEEYDEKNPDTYYEEV
jgi:UDP-2-acetamido-2,6-beta-L-arabino-hexul-4-ose reductase